MRDFVNIADKTSTNGVRITSLQSKATLVQLGGFPTHHREGGRVENAIIMKLRGRKKMCQQTTEQPKEETPDLSDQFNELLRNHGFENEQTADVAGVVAKELGLYEGELK